MTCNQDCNQGRTCECADSHDDWVDEVFGIVQTALVWIGACAALAVLIGFVYGWGTK
jgi:hypothetical protein